MATRSYNEYLDIGHSEGDDFSQNDSDDAQEAKGKVAQAKTSTKRRKSHHESSGEESDNEIALVPNLSFSSAPNTISSPSSKPPVADEFSTREDSIHPATSSTLRSKNPTTTFKKPGVIYLSRIPPFMRPSTVRHLLSPFGPITKLFMTPEPPAQHTSRVRSGGNKK
ncbi:MAG: hypothetical protein Q9177_004598, partial [Variospora cf. flavescens]